MRRALKLVSQGAESLRFAAGALQTTADTAPGVSNYQEPIRSFDESNSNVAYLRPVAAF